MKEDRRLLVSSNGALTFIPEKDYKDGEHQVIPSFIRIEDVKVHGSMSRLALRKGEIYCVYLPEEGRTSVGYVDYNGVEKAIEDGFLNAHNYSDVFCGRFYEKYGRVTRPGRFYKKIYPFMTDKEIAEQSDIWKGTYLMKGVTIEEHWNDWRSLYRYDNAVECGTIGNSCMRHNQAQDYLRFYTENGVGLLTLMKDNLVVARSLLWKVEIGGQIHTFVDRLYYDDGYRVQQVKEYAEKKGYYMRLDSTCDPHYVTFPDGTKARTRVMYTLDHMTDYAPYLDTFKYLFKHDLTGEYLVSNHDTALEKWTYCCMLENLDGGWSDYEEGYVWSEWHQQDIPEEDAVYCEVYDDYIFSGYSCYSEHANSYINCDDEDYVWCELDQDYIYYEYTVRLASGEYAWAENKDVVYCEMEDVYCCTDYAVFSEVRGTYITQDKAIEYKIGGGDSDYDHENNLKEYLTDYEGELIHKDSEIRELPDGGICLREEYQVALMTYPCETKQFKLNFEEEREAV
jgi:hypothetical protein